MFNKKTLFAGIALFCASVLGVSDANAQSPSCYTLASLQGSYAVIGNYGANVAIAVGRRYFDANGNVTATFTVNEPTAGSTTGARTIVTGTQEGTYTMNCDGTGVMTLKLSTSNGITATALVSDFVITGAAAISTYPVTLIATGLTDAQRVPSAIVAGGVFLTRTYTRLPDLPPAL